MESKMRARKRKDFSRGRDQWSCPIEDEQRSSMMQPSLNESRPRDDASFINPGQSERERERSRELETLKGIFFAGCHRFTRRPRRFNQWNYSVDGFVSRSRETIPSSLFFYDLFQRVPFLPPVNEKMFLEQTSKNSTLKRDKTWNGSWNGAFERLGFSESWW